MMHEKLIKMNLSDAYSSNNNNLNFFLVADDVEVEDILQNQNVLNRRRSQSEELKNGRNLSSLVLRWLSRRQSCRHDQTLATMQPRRQPTRLSVIHPRAVATIPMSPTTEDEL